MGGHGSERAGDGRDGEAAALCPACGEPLEPYDRFCEACGRAARADDGGHVETELPGRAAGVSDTGLARDRNEDALAMAAVPRTRTVCAVVCDGVAAAPGSDRAARVAADTGTAALVERLEAGDGPEKATRAALDRASRAVADLAAGHRNPPACTYVSAVVEPRSVTVGWVGDSRAYWISCRGDRGSLLLTRDDSWADLMISRRAMSEPAARADPRAHLLTGWLGSAAAAFAPHAATFRPKGPGAVLVCSDGLWNHLPDAATLEEAARAAAGRDDGLLDVARGLVQAALDGGGHDNVTVALIPYPPLPYPPLPPRSTDPDPPDEPPREPLR
ncbi:protein phosphatase 2C domain-containing protein [Spirillospora sp. NPDC029432]|uniref:protein phosphatase 2C domain-containing protein n=1 Tax=Spirillospora sp. NPDC029432 TaxID=3154599 RepID=UPI0034561E57